MPKMSIDEWLAQQEKAAKPTIKPAATPVSKPMATTKPLVKQPTKGKTKPDIDTWLAQQSDEAITPALTKKQEIAQLQAELEARPAEAKLPQPDIVAPKPLVKKAGPLDLLGGLVQAGKIAHKALAPKVEERRAAEAAKYIPVSAGTLAGVTAASGGKKVLQTLTGAGKAILDVATGQIAARPTIDELFSMPKEKWDADLRARLEPLMPKQETVMIMGQPYTKPMAPADKQRLQLELDKWWNEKAFMRKEFKGARELLQKSIAEDVRKLEKAPPGQKLAYQVGSELPRQLGQIGLAVATGGSVAPIGLTAAGETWSELEEQGVPYGQRVLRSVASGLIEAGTERISVPQWMKFFKKSGGDELIQAGAQVAAKGGMGKIGKWLSTPLGQWIKSAAGELGEELLADPLHNLADILILGEKKPIWTLAQTKETAIQAGALSLILGALGLPANMKAHQMAQQMMQQDEAPNPAKAEKLKQQLDVDIRELSDKTAAEIAGKPIEEQIEAMRKMKPRVTGPFPTVKTDIAQMPGIRQKTGGGVEVEITPESLERQWRYWDDRAKNPMMGREGIEQERAYAESVRASVEEEMRKRGIEIPGAKGAKPPIPAPSVGAGAVLDAQTRKRILSMYKEKPPVQIAKELGLETAQVMAVINEAEGKAPAAPTPVPEAPATLAAQMGLLRDGITNAVLFTRGEPLLETPEGFSTLETERGVFVYDPKKISEKEIRQAVAEDRIGDILDYGIPSKPAKPIGVIEVVDEKGNEVRSIVVDQEHLAEVRKRAEAIAAQRPGWQVRMVDAADVIAKRMEVKPAPKIPAPIPDIGGSINQIEARKNPAGHYQLFFRGTRNEVFPGEKFRTAQEARQYWMAMKAKQAEKPAPEAGPIGAPKKSLEQQAIEKTGQENPAMLSYDEFRDAMLSPELTQIHNHRVRTRGYEFADVAELSRFLDQLERAAGSAKYGDYVKEEVEKAYAALYRDDIAGVTEHGERAVAMLHEGELEGDEYTERYVEDRGRSFSLELYRAAAQNAIKKGVPFHANALELTGVRTPEGYVLDEEKNLYVHKPVAPMPGKAGPVGVPIAKKPLKPLEKKASTMSAAEINKELDRLDKQRSKNNQALIDAGRGNETTSEIFKKDDPLSREAKAISDRRMELRREIEARYGPNAPSRLPAGFGAREKVAPKPLVKKGVGTVEQQAAKRVTEAETAGPALGLLPGKKPARRSPFAFADQAVEARWQAAKGLPPEKGKIAEVITDAWHKMTREFEHLPKTAEFSPIRNQLLTLKKQRDVAMRKTIDRLRDVVLRLEADEFDLFTRRVVMDDLAACLERNEQIPFWPDAESFKRDKATIDQSVSQNPIVQEALQKRREHWDEVKQNYIKAMEDIGFDVKERLTRSNYFHHQVLEYAQAQGIARTGKRLKTPTGRGFLKGRTGEYIGDINVDYLQAETEVIAQMVHDVEVAKTIKLVMDKYDITEQLKAEAKQKGIDDWQTLIPEDYRKPLWQPRQGSIFYFADSIPAKLAEQLKTGALEKLDITVDDLRPILAMGGLRKGLAIPETLAKTLDDLTKPPEGALSQAATAINGTWKIWQLFSPKRFLKYETRNLSGDADHVFVGNPKAFLKVPRAISELYKVIVHNAGMTPEMRDWFEHGGMQSTLFAQEISDVNKLKVFDRFLDEKGNFKSLPAKAIKLYWNTIRGADTLREATLRYAAYLDYLEQMKANPEGRPKNFGASDRAEIMALENIEDRAYKLSNDLLGAYDQVSVVGQYLRRRAYPFWSWVEVNFKIYKGLLKNAVADGKAASTVGRALGVGAPKTAYMVGKFAIKAAALWAALNTWNYLKFRNEEEELPEEVRRKPHIIFGRDKDGKILYFSRLGAVADFVEWFGLDDPVMMTQDFLNGRKTIKEIAVEMAKAPITKISQGITPFIKVPFELLTKKKLYPDPFKPGTIRDPWLHVADSLGFRDEYIAVKGLPSRGYLQSWQSAYSYRADPDEIAYWTIIDCKFDFQRKQGKGGSGFSPVLTPRSNALYNLKLAIRYGDKKAMEKYLLEYAQAQGTKTGLVQSMKSLHPLYGLRKDELKAFKEYLTAEEARALERAIRYYEDLMRAMPEIKKAAKELKMPKRTR